MTNYEWQKEFDKIERLIAINTEKGLDTKNLLRQKISLLKVNYNKLADAIKNNDFPNIVPIFAKELAFLNNIKDIQTQINDNTEETEQEIAKIHSQMREKGFGWILDNQPEKKSE